MPETYQAIYMVAPSGKLLGYLHVSEFYQGFAPAMEAALKKWNVMPENQRRMDRNLQKQLEAIPQFHPSYPVNGLVLHEYARDFPHEHPPEFEREKVWKKVPGSQWNQNFAWFTQQEALQFVPAQPRLKARHQIPDSIMRRFTSIHLTDWRSAFYFFERHEVKNATLSSIVTAIKGPRISLRLEGATAAEAGERGSKNKPWRTMDTILLGKATFNLNTSRFEFFELIACGIRSGNDVLYDRLFSTGPSPVGFVFTLAGNSLRERLEPGWFYKYGWQK